MSEEDWFCGSRSLALNHMQTFIWALCPLCNFSFGVCLFKQVAYVSKTYWGLNTHIPKEVCPSGLTWGETVGVEMLIHTLNSPSYCGASLFLRLRFRTLVFLALGLAGCLTTSRLPYSFCRRVYASVCSKRWLISAGHSSLDCWGGTVTEERWHNGFWPQSSQFYTHHHYFLTFLFSPGEKWKALTGWGPTCSHFASVVKSDSVIIRDTINHEV